MTTTTKARPLSEHRDMADAATKWREDHDYEPSMTCAVCDIDATDVSECEECGTYGCECVVAEYRAYDCRYTAHLDGRMLCRKCDPACNCPECDPDAALERLRDW